MVGNLRKIVKTSSLVCLCNKYTLFDGLAYITCGYFASCVVFFRALLGLGKIRAMNKMIRKMNKMFAGIICQTIDREVDFSTAKNLLFWLLFSDKSIQNILILLHPPVFALL